MNRLSSGVLIASEVESLEQSALPGIHLGEHVDGARLGLSSRDRARRISQGHFFDLGQTSNQAGNADVDAFLSELTLQEANEQQSHDAEESMHADFLVGPMMHGPPATGFGIFHGAKAIIQLVLPPVAEHDERFRSLLLVAHASSD